MIQVGIELETLLENSNLLPLGHKWGIVVQRVINYLPIFFTKKKKKKKTIPIKKTTTKQDAGRKQKYKES
ncbi:hypothetical protein HanRHA438_Chr05g0228621 [Helianthus annuus]|nr:hypothetical protein HanRHA438_Chr05g0228621 [Helianthus annuus]